MMERVARDERSTCRNVLRKELGSWLDDEMGLVATEDVNLMEDASTSGLRKREGVETSDERREADRLNCCERLAEAEAEAGSESSVVHSCWSLLDSES